VILMSLTLVLVIALTAAWGLNGWVVGRVTSEVVFFVGMILVVRKEIVVEWNMRVTRRLLTFGGYAAVALLVWRIQVTADVLYLDWWLRDATQIGYYGVATLMMNGLVLVPAAVSAAAFPYLSERSSDLHATLSLLGAILKKVMVLMLGLCVVASVVAPPLMVWVLGAKYASVGTLFRILVPAAFLGSIVTIVGNFLLAIERAHFTLIINVVAALSSLALNYVLIPVYGAIGSAWAMVINLAIQTALYAGIVIYLRRPRARLQRRTIMHELEGQNGGVVPSDS